MSRRFVHAISADTLRSEMAAALTCPWCGAPLPAVVPGQPFATCAYCGATSNLGGDRPTKGQAPTGAAPAVAASSAELQQRVIDAFKAARERGASPYDALVAAARERLGPLGQTDALARVCLALGRDFVAEHGTSVVEDPIAMSRLVEAYLKAIEVVRTEGRYDANLPFLVATSKGPKHYQRTLTADLIAELAARDPAPPPPPPKKKRGFWPFG